MSVGPFIPSSARWLVWRAWHQAQCVTTVPLLGSGLAYERAKSLQRKASAFYRYKNISDAQVY